MQYYELFEKYKRSLYFFYSDKNPISGLDLCKGVKQNTSEVLKYEVEKIDDYLFKYDYLPVSSGPPLVSNQFRKTFFNYNNFNVEYFNALIVSKDGNYDDTFLALNILDSYDGMDKQRSIYEINKYGILKIKKLFLNSGFMKDSLISRLGEKKSIIIVNDVFKEICSKNKLKGMDFVEEGYSIFTDI